MEFVYKLGIKAYATGITIASLFNSKAKKWISGRVSWRTTLKEEVKNLRNQVVWVHCASVGEYEQAIPILEELKKKREVSVVLSFFSPSGYEHHKATKLADVVTYLPMDSAENAKQFLGIVKPVQAVFVKYEFWYYYLKELHNRSISTFLVSAVFRADQYFFKTYGKWFRNSLHWYSKIFVQNRVSLDLLASIGVLNVEVSGDTRLDRVLSLVAAEAQFPLLEKFRNESKILIAGSSWETEDEWMIKLITEESIPGWKFIIAPHEIDENKLRKIEGKIKCIRYSKLESRNAQSVILCDGYGYLSKIYRYADVALVGGGFNSGIHSILEPSAFGMPILFGPDNNAFVEAKALIQLGSGFEVSSYEEFRSAFFELINSPNNLKRLSTLAREYVNENSGGSKFIAKELALNLEN